MVQLCFEKVKPNYQASISSSPKEIDDIQDHRHWFSKWNITLDKKNGDTFWRDAFDKELKNMLVVFKLLQSGENIPVGSKGIPHHISF